MSRENFPEPGELQEPPEVFEPTDPTAPKNSEDEETQWTVRSIGDLEPRPPNDPDELLQHRYLCRGGGLLIAAPTGIGKSTLAMQCALCWSIGRECLGIVPARPLKSVLVQAENDDGDLYELREGVLRGLKFSEEERKLAFANFVFVTVDDKCGPEFPTFVLGPLCEREKPDLIWVDPLFAYIGGAVGGQEIVTPWLRNRLNPVLHRHRVGGVLVHHSNKPPTGQAKPGWQAGDFAYLGSGSNELANWPRAIIAIRAIGRHDVYELLLAKRGARVGWKNEDGTACYAKHIAHGTDGIYWREATPEELPEGPGRKRMWTVEDALECLDGAMRRVDWQARCKDTLGIKVSSFDRLFRECRDQSLITKSQTGEKWFKKP